MKKSEKSFDAVRMMREVRDKLSDRFKDMSFEEQKRYMRKHISSKPTEIRDTSGSTHAA